MAPVHLDCRATRRSLFPSWLLPILASLVGSGWSPALAAPQVARDGWKDCSFNDVVIGCVDQPLGQGLRVVWKDGLRMTYRQEPPRQPGEPPLLRDQLGGVWRREALPQGNTVLTNVANGNRIAIPLRFPCKPPLQGEVGYCRD